MKNKLILFIFFLIAFHIKIYSQDFVFFLDSQDEFSYQSSWGFNTSPSRVEIVFARFPISNKYKFSGKNSLKLHWKSIKGGDWGIAAASDGWAPNDFTLKDTISFMLYTRNKIQSKDLPIMYLEDVYNNKTLKVTISDYVKKLNLKSGKEFQFRFQCLKELLIM